ncbi:outer membrane protein assembly factor BamB family protein [Streptomyces sp. NBC_00322]|uniref:outer membrane protein assembly factor BamB family protein n=1 Tax=Streptomyces sp. NBC_00322 TaxID=2975712 RepID=UPI002E2AEAEE|nr:PQQ-binding-like beta-propeller repeat protein [Streptomyces sp. NBC_00322]
MPTTQPGYGCPPQAAGQPGPYNQPPGPYGGHPVPSQYSGGTTPLNSSGGGGFFKGRRVAVIGAVVAGLLVIGGGTWFALSGDGKDDKSGVSKGSGTPKPSGSASAGQGATDDTIGVEGVNARRSPGEARVLFLKQNDVDVPGNGAEVFGPWVVGDTIVKAMYRDVAGYSVTDGKKKWSLKLGTPACLGAPQASTDGKIVIGVRNGTTEKSDCSDLQMIDAKTGKAGWKKPIPKPKGVVGFTDYILAVSGNTVALTGLDHSYGFSVSDGKQLFGKPSSRCLPYGFAGGARLLAAASCPTSKTENVKQEIQNVDPATGKATWTYALPANWEVDKVYSVSPVVVALKHQVDDTDENTEHRVIALTDAGRLRSQLQVGKDKFKPRCSSTASIAYRGDIQGWCTGVAADASTLYLATEPTGTNEVVAFNLDTGKATWRSSVGLDRTMMPLTVENGSVVVYIAPTFSEGGAVATIAPTGGTPKVLLKHPLSTAEIESGFQDPRTAYADGRIFLTTTQITGLDDAREKETKTLMAFGK